MGEFHINLIPTYDDAHNLTDDLQSVSSSPYSVTLPKNRSRSRSDLSEVADRSVSTGALDRLVPNPGKIRVDRRVVSDSHGDPSVSASQNGPSLTHHLSHANLNTYNNNLHTPQKLKSSVSYSSLHRTPNNNFDTSFQSLQSEQSFHTAPSPDGLLSSSPNDRLKFQKSRDILRQGAPSPLNLTPGNRSVNATSPHPPTPSAYLFENETQQEPPKQSPIQYSSPHPIGNAISWKADEPANWTLDRVLMFLDLYQFGPDWAQTFKERNIVENRFLELVSYQKLKALGHLSLSNGEVDTSPSRFIHILRKTLNRGTSSGTIDVDALNSSQSSDGTTAGRQTAQGSTSSPQQPFSPQNGSPVISQNSPVPHHSPAPTEPPPPPPTSAPPPPAFPQPKAHIPNSPSTSSLTSPLVPTSSAPADKITPRPLKTNRPQRPMTAYEGLYRTMKSPVSPSGNFFRRTHHKSSSSESSILGEDGQPKEEERKSRNLFSRLRRRDRSSSKSRGTIPPSPVEPDGSSIYSNDSKDKVSPTLTSSSGWAPPKPPKVPIPNPSFNPPPLPPRSGSQQTPTSASTHHSSLSGFSVSSQPAPSTPLDRYFTTTKNDRMILVTLDNVHFVAADLKNVLSVPQATDVIAKALDLNTRDLRFRLTDIGSEASEKLDEEALSYVFSDGKVMLSNYKLLVESASPSATLGPVSTAQSASSVTSSPGKSVYSLETPSGGTKYPATPSYLYTKPQEAAGDYFSSQPPSKLTRQPSQTSIQTAMDDQDSFKVIRPPPKKEINFDNRRSSPYDTLSRNTSFVARREAPRRPESSSSVRVRSTAVNSYTPGESEKFIPRPYHGGSNRLVMRKPVSAASSPVDQQSNDPTANVPPSAPQPSRLNPKLSGNFTFGRSGLKFKVPNYQDKLQRRSTASSVRVPPEQNFQENDISFDDIQFDDDDDESDDGLWSKKLTKPTEAVSSAVSSTRTSTSSSSDVWAVRPPAEVVYDNLERFFPNADLDKPIIDDIESPPASPDKRETLDYVKPRSMIIDQAQERKAAITPLTKVADIKEESTPEKDEKPKFSRKTGTSRIKSIRVVAREASEARKRFSTSSTKSTATNPALLRRRSTKMWGQKVVEATPNQIKKGHISTVRDQRGHLKKFVWVKGELIGVGTFGKVYLALNATTGDMMAVKQVEVRNKAAAEVGVGALHAEVGTMKNLDHFNIVQYLGFETMQDHTYNLFLEYVPGGSVGSCLRNHGRFAENIVRFLTRQILEGLAYLHGCGILHRDLKSDNLLLDLDGVCKISDFGISKKSRDIYSNDAEMSMQGTIFWMAPEVIHNVIHNEKQGYSAKVDIWSLGCVVLEMFAGRRPWSNDEAIGAMYKLGNSRLAPPIPEDTKKFVSDDAKDFLDKCFIIDPEQRPTARQLLDHPFCKLDQDFNFLDTSLAKVIRFNDKRPIQES
ncbi:Serine/threonine-protein kinase BCK1/SLK1/SSP31 [Yarrowia sp. B02]|nr:Serine/threonine-protein kinase BCK1/SLK1/SSP31 [Yarrowia sp. B02]